MSDDPALVSINTVRWRIEWIKEIIDDKYESHWNEYNMYRDVLLAISEGRGGDPKALAKEALKSQHLDLPRAGSFQVAKFQPP